MNYYIWIFWTWTTRSTKCKTPLTQEAIIKKSRALIVTVRGNEILHARASQYHQSELFSAREWLCCFFKVKQEQCFGGNMNIKWSFCKTKQKMPLWSIVPFSCFYCLQIELQVAWHCLKVQWLFLCYICSSILYCRPSLRERGNKAYISRP